MSESDIRKTAELKETVEREIDDLLKELKAGTIDRNKLEHGLKKVQVTVQRIPPHKA